MRFQWGDLTVYMLIKATGRQWSLGMCEQEPSSPYYAFVVDNGTLLNRFLL